MKPLLAHVYELHRVTYPCYVQPKLNGIRALYQNGRFQSRDELPFNEGLLRHLSNPLREVFGPETILDGELYIHGWLLQRINAAVTPVRLTPTEDTLKVEYHVFDVVDFGKSFGDRFRPFCPSVNLMAKDIGPIKWVQWDMPSDEQDANRCYARFVATGYEGMMYRLGDCPYTVPKQTKWDHKEQVYPAWREPIRTKFLSDKDNRCWHLLKRKDWQDDEFECREVVEGEGKLKGTLGALVCIAKTKPLGIFRIGPRFSVGSGLTDAERQHYWQNPPIGHQIKVKYLCLSSDGIPLNPTILAIL